MILSLYVFYILSAVMNFCCHLVSMTTMHSLFEKKIFRKGIILVRKQIKKQGRKCFYNQIKLNFTDILAVAKEWLFYRLP